MNLPGSIRTALITILLLCPLTLAAGTTKPLGDWVGWMYLDQGGDLPLRLRIESGDEGLTARFDELVSRRYDLPVERLVWEPPKFSLTRRLPSGSTIRLDGLIQAEAISGRIDWAGHLGDFELARSPELLTRTPPETYAGCEGIYRLSNDQTLVISSRFWGELLFTNVDTGAFGTLFPVDTDQFFVGSAIYVPAPIRARVRFTRSGDHVDGIEWAEAGSEAIEGTRTGIVEEEVSFESDGATLAGTILRPEGASALLPGAVVLGGSNWTERSGTRRDAEILSSFGMATLIYDKRGAGESEGMPTVPFRQTARDAAAAVRFLESRADVIDGQVGLVGRSRTGWVAPLAASFEPRITFLVLLVPPAVSPAAQETTRRLHELEDAGAGPETLQAVHAMLDAAWRFAHSGTGWDDYVRLREQAKQLGAPDDVFEPGAPDDPEWQWTRMNMSYDPIPILSMLKTPLLALFGGKDRNVVPEINAPLWRDAMKAAGNRDANLVVIPGVNHGLRIVTEGPAVPMHRQQGLAPSGWTEIRAWLARHIDLGGPSS